MEQVIFLEIIAKDGKVIRRERLERLPAVIGRAYAADVIIDDPTVSPRHISAGLDNEGRLEISDLDSLNGVLLVRQGKSSRVKTASIEPDDCLLLGHTRLRLRKADCAVPEALDVRKTRDPFSSWPLACSILILALLALVIPALAVNSDWWRPQVLAEEAAAAFLAAVGFVLVWTACWAAASRIHVGRASFWGHLSAVSSALIIAACFGTAAPVASFALNNELFGEVLDYTGLALAVCMLVAWHLCYATYASSRRRLLFGTVCAAILVVATLGMERTKAWKFSPSPSTEHVILPEDFRLTQPKTIEQLAGELDSLKDQIVWE